MENNIKIVRFKDGLDVICFYFLYENMLEIKNPMVFEVRNGNLIMNQWLPLSLMKTNHVVVKMEDVLCMYDPNESFEEYYLNTVEKMNEFLEQKASKENEEMMEILKAVEELETYKGITVH